MARSPLWRAVLIVLAVLLIPIVPFALFGEQSEQWISENLLGAAIAESGGWVTALSVILVLAADILLPVPSSAALTFAGASLGLVIGTLAGWLGLMLSCLLGYWLGLRFGLPQATRLSSAAQLRSATDKLDRTGSWILLGSRAIPVLAEACVLISGVYQFKLRRFIAAVGLANLILALAYCTLGWRAYDGGWITVALLVSVIVPLLLVAGLALLRRQD